MPTALEQLLSDIDPLRTYEQTFARADEAINTFSFDCDQVKDWRDFKTCLAEFFTHVEAKLLQLHPCPLNLDFHWAGCKQSLRSIYGDRGEKAAFEMARTGNESGLYSVLSDVALRMAEEFVESKISARVDQLWDELSVDEQLSIVTEYLVKYGHLLSSEITQSGPARIQENFPRVLDRHIRIIHRKHRLKR